MVNGKDAAVKEQDGGLGEGDAHVVQDIGRERDLEVVVELGDGIGGDVVAAPLIEGAEIKRVPISTPTSKRSDARTAQSSHL